MSGIEAVQARISQLDVLLGTTGARWPSGLQSVASTSSGATAAGGSFSEAMAGAAPAGQAVAGLEPVACPNAAVAVPYRIPGSQTAERPEETAGTGPAGVPAFSSPLPGGRLTQRFGATTFELEPAATIDGVHYKHFHAGIDLAAPLGTPLLAAADGTVVAAGRAKDGAVIVKIRHADGSVTLYGHLQKDLPVRVGDRVVAGQKIGEVGLTGNTTGPHVHFALYGKDGTPLDPQIWLAAGRLPGQAAASPSAAQSSGTLNWRLSDAGLARFDAAASRIPYASLIRSAAVKAGIDPLLLASLVDAESGFHSKAVSRCGAMGLTQLMPATARSLGVGDTFDPAQNLAGGARYLASQLERFGSVDMALAAYNAGPSTVARLGHVPDSPSLHGYIRHITNNWKRYSEAAA